MLALETKQSGGKLLPTRISGGSVFLGETLCSIQRERKIGTWYVRSLYRTRSLKAAIRELVRYELDAVSVQEVRWDKGGTVRAGDYDFSPGKEMKIINWEKVFLYIVE
jgi:hypothetical protein